MLEGFYAERQNNVTQVLELFDENIGESIRHKELKISCDKDIKR